MSRPAGWGKSLRQSITSSHSAHASIVALDRDGPTATEPSSLEGVTAVASVVPLTVCRSPSIDPNATRSYVHTLSQTRRWRSNGHCAVTETFLFEADRMTGKISAGGDRILPALNEGSAWKTHACARRFLTERPARRAHGHTLLGSRLRALRRLPSKAHRYRCRRLSGRRS